MAHIGRPPVPAMERFWNYVNKTDSCWEWTGAKDRDGYGVFAVSWTKQVRAHRFSYEMEYGPIPKGKTLDHLCRNRGCIKPSHLEAVTSQENTLRGIGLAAENAKKTHCKRGHPLSGDNIWLIAGRRYCKTCSKLRQTGNIL